jgi:hypothetical protein
MRHRKLSTSPKEQISAKRNLFEELSEGICAISKPSLIVRTHTIAVKFSRLHKSPSQR